MFAYKTSCHSSTKKTPYEMLFGRKPKIPADLMFSDIEFDLHLTPDSYASKIQTTLKKSYEVATCHRDVNSLRNKIRLDRSVRACKFDVGDTVFILRHSKKVNESNKFRRKWINEPYRIISVTSPVNYCVQSISNPSIKKIVHQTQMKRAYLDRYKNDTSYPNQIMHNDYTERVRAKEQLQSSVNNYDLVQIDTDLENSSLSQLEYKDEFVNDESNAHMKSTTENNENIL